MPDPQQLTEPGKSVKGIRSIRRIMDTPQVVHVIQDDYDQQASAYQQMASAMRLKRHTDAVDPNGRALCRHSVGPAAVPRYAWQGSKTGYARYASEKS